MFARQLVSSVQVKAKLYFISVENFSYLVNMLP